MEVKQLVYLSLGSNLGDRLKTIEDAIETIQTVGTIKDKSSIYECKAVGFESNDLFYNCCICIETSLLPLDLLAFLNDIEKNAGRIRLNDEKYHSRNLDIDILFYGNQSIQLANLIIPHPRYQERKFVLIPLFEITNNLKDPINNFSIANILYNCKDKSVLKKISV